VSGKVLLGLASIVVSVPSAGDSLPYFTVSRLVGVVRLLRKGFGFGTFYRSFISALISFK
jgi:hypothetical protein